MSNWSIGRKISFALAVSLLGLIVVATLAYSNIAKLTKTAQWVTHTHQVLEAREEILSLLKDAETGQRGFVITGEPRYLNPYNNAVTNLPRAISHLRELTIDNAAQQQRISELEPLISGKLAELKQTIDLRSQKGFEPAQKVVLTDAGKAAMDQIRGKAGEIENAERTLLQTREADAESSVQSTRVSLLITSILAVLISAFICINLIRSMSFRLGEAVTALEQVADGDLTVSIEVRSKDEIGQMAEALNKATEKLNSTMQEVADSAANASSSSQQLAAASEAIASGAQEQASSLEETSASLEEITAAVRQSADNAQQASQLASSSKDSAEQGQQVVSSAVTAMSEINVASAKISDIISTIDEIAFQTNLLAVNAAVEAARAGEEGRGFAVVASEVRSLAQRSAVAAKEIKVLIQDSLRKVEAGSALVNRSGETLLGIVGSVKRVTDIVGEIAAASGEQSSGIDQVNTAVTQMDQVTQSNSAQTEELSATAQSLSEQAARLLELVNTFTISQGGRNGRERRAFQTHEDNPAHSWTSIVQSALPSAGTQQSAQVAQRPAKARNTASAKPNARARAGKSGNSQQPALAMTVAAASAGSGGSDASFEEF